MNIVALYHVTTVSLNITEPVPYLNPKDNFGMSSDLDLLNNLLIRYLKM